MGLPDDRAQHHHRRRRYAHRRDLADGDSMTRDDDPRVEMGLWLENEGPVEDRMATIFYRWLLAEMWRRDYRLVTWTVPTGQVLGSCLPSTSEHL